MQVQFARTLEDDSIHLIELGECCTVNIEEDADSDKSSRRNCLVIELRRTEEVSVVGCLLPVIY